MVARIPLVCVLETKQSHLQELLDLEIGGTITPAIELAKSFSGSQNLLETFVHTFSSQTSQLLSQTNDRHLVMEDLNFSRIGIAEPADESFDHMR